MKLLEAAFRRGSREENLEQGRSLDDRMQGSWEVQPTVNSVRGRWTLQARDLPPDSKQCLIVTARLESADGRTALPTASSAEETHEDLAVGADGCLALSGSSGFHFLRSNTSYVLVLEVSGSVQAGQVTKSKFDTSPVGQGFHPSMQRQLPREMWTLYIGKEHELGEWLGHSPDDFVWVFRPDYETLRNLWLNGCFTLLNVGSPMAQCPNPKKRYCLDLVSPTKTINWLSAKKVKRHKSDFELTVNRDYSGTFNRVEQLHTEMGRGTWITKELVEALDRCRREDREIKVYAVELWEKSTGKLAAAIMSFSVGDIFHDYSTATFLRDQRSAGSILSKVLGHLLVKCGYTLWYWGFKNPYMAEYDVYGGCELDNASEFWPRWKAAVSNARGPAPCDLASCFPNGLGSSLDLAVLE